jgi:WD40 repeat protein
MECVAIGAAIQAAVITGEVTDLLLMDVTPLSLGVETLGHVRTKIMEKNTTIPTSRSQIFTTSADFQTAITIHVLQGERAMASDNISLGKFNLENIPPAPRGVPQVQVTFEVDANGILSVEAKELGTGKEARITITASTKLSKEEKERLVREAEEFAEQDKKKREEADIRNNADNLVYTAEKNKKDLGEKLTQEQKNSIDASVSALKDALAGTDSDKVKSKSDELTKLLQDVGTVIYQQAAAEQARQRGPQVQPRNVLLPGHVGCVRAAGSSADGSIMATGSYDGSVCLWNPATGRQVGKFNVESDIGTLAMSSDGTKVIIGCNSNFVEVWEAETGRRLVQMKGHMSFPCSSMDCSLNGRWAASASWEEVGVFLWNLEAGRLERRIVPKDAPYSKAVSISFSPNSERLAVGHADGIFIYDVLSGELVVRLGGHSGARCQFVKFLNDDLIASIGADDNVKIQSISQKALLKQRQIETARAISAGAVSDDGKHVAVGEGHGEVSEMNLETGAVVMERTNAHRGKQIMAVMYVPRTHMWISSDVSGTVYLWNPSGTDHMPATPTTKTSAERIQELETFLKQRPNWAAGHEQLAIEYWEQGDVVNMFRHFYAAAQADPSSNSPHKYLKAVYDGMACYEDFRREDAADKATDHHAFGRTVLVPQLSAQIRKLARERKIELENVIREFQS